MDKEQIKSEYEQLCKQAEQHNFNYYVLDDPTIEDDEYDRLMRRIKEIEAENPDIVSESSPTQHVGGYAINTFEKVTHEVQMGSLQDVFSKGELYEFDERVKKAVGKAVYCVEPKIDGLSVSLEYKDGIDTVFFLGCNAGALALRGCFRSWLFCLGVENGIDDSFSCYRNRRKHLLQKEKILLIRRCFYGRNKAKPGTDFKAN